MSAEFRGNPEHLAILKQGVQVWNRWREENPGVRPELRGAGLPRADLIGADLIGADLHEADLGGAYLSEAYLCRADLGRADLHEAVLGGANLHGADLLGADLREAGLFDAVLSRAYLVLARLSGADLSGAYLRRADLRRARLGGANLSGADLSEADPNEADFSECILQRTVFGNVDLSAAIGLGTVLHEGPSTIGVDTLFRSKGNIPEVFLRGCGVPETLIQYLPALIAATGAVQYHSCFISHSHADRKFCERLYADLQRLGVRVWYFPDDARVGRTVWGEIDESMRAHDKLVVVCSEDSLKSAPVLAQIERGLQRELQRKEGVLFPITLDGFVYEGWEHYLQASLLQKVVGDFRGWDGNEMVYQKALAKLLKGLQGGEG